MWRLTGTGRHEAEQFTAQVVERVRRKAAAARERYHSLDVKPNELSQAQRKR